MTWGASSSLCSCPPLGAALLRSRYVPPHRPRSGAAAAAPLVGAAAAAPRPWPTASSGGESTLGAGRALPRGRAVGPARRLRRRRGDVGRALGPGPGAAQRLRRRPAPALPVFATSSPSPCWSRSPPTTWASCGWPSRRPPSPPRADPAHREQGLGGGLVEVHPDRLGRHRAGLRGHGARLFRLRQLGGPARVRPQLDACCRQRRRCTRRSSSSPSCSSSIGYGTKAGLAPMHTWLPDAHSEAPSAALGHDVGRAPRGGPLRDHALESGGAAAVGPSSRTGSCRPGPALPRHRRALASSSSASTSGCSPTRASSTLGSCAWGSPWGPSACSPPCCTCSITPWPSR